MATSTSGLRLENKTPHRGRMAELFVYHHRYATISTPVVTPERVFIASGHVDHFKDLMVSCNNVRGISEPIK